uniref:SAYSvFN domain-containing protein n=2 Tax=Schistocephalus solidus TaxID=70667 RepID=A0A0X3PWJ5_SCHSO
MDYKQFREGLQQSRASHSSRSPVDKSQLKQRQPDTSPRVASPSSAQVESVDTDVKVGAEVPTGWLKPVGTWRVQLAFTLLLWISLVHVGFGAIFFILACIYWLWAWGTEARRQTRPPNTIQAGWYFDNRMGI